jgi:predicted transcriptional regulator
MPLRESPHEEADGSDATEKRTASEELLELLDTEYTQRILEAVRTEPKPARALAEECDASRPTVYRRLNSLQEAGLVETSMTYDADGHHRTVFEATLESITVDVRDDGFSVTITTSAKDRSPSRPSDPVPGR